MDSDLLTKVGPGTPMGSLMRQYWIPAAKSNELEPGGAPLRLMLLGEKLIAFRDVTGRVGVLEHQCPHRCASLFFGRNEEGGIRCAYHGWKFDFTGKCLDQPNLPEKFQFKDRVAAKAYPTAERNGIVYVYMGERSEPPPLPQIEAMLLPEDEVTLTFCLRECNWAQALEGDIDTSHIGFLHFGGLNPPDFHPESNWALAVSNRAPEYEVVEMPFGVSYGGYREGRNPSERYWRVSHFMFPFWTVVPEGLFADHIFARAWVPMDDTHTMFVFALWKKNQTSARYLADGEAVPGASFDIELRPNTTDWYGRFRPIHSAENDYLIDRELQKRNSYTGIDSLYAQDQAVTESMGGIVDHSKEHLSISDRMIVVTRRRLEAAARALAEEGVLPPGVDEPHIYAGARGGEFFAPADKPFQRAYVDNLRIATDPTGILKLADV